MRLTSLLAAVGVSCAVVSNAEPTEPPIAPGVAVRHEMLRVDEIATAIELVQRGRYRDAIAPLRRAAQQPLDNSLRARVWVALAEVEIELGNYGTARDAAASAIDVYTAIPASDSSDARVMLARASRLAGDYTGSRRVLNQSGTEIDAPEKANINWLLESAELSRETGAIETAQELTLKAVALAEGRADREQVVARALSQLAALYIQRRRLDEAEALAVRALAQLRDSGDTDSIWVAKSLNVFGNVYYSKLVDAHVIYEQALKIAMQQLGSEAPIVGLLQVRLAASLDRQTGREAAAQEIRRRGLATLEQTLGPDHPEMAFAQSIAARDFASQGATALAESIYERSLARLQKEGYMHPALPETLLGASRVYKDGGRFDDELVVIRRLSALYRERISHDVTDELAVTEARANRGGFQRHLALLSLNPLHDAPDEVAEESFRIAQLYQFTSTAAAIAKLAERMNAADGQLGQLVRQRQDIVADKQRIWSELLNRIGKVPDSRNAAEEQSLRRKLEIGTEQVRRLDSEIRGQFPKYDALINGEPLDVREAQGLLREDEALIVIITQPIGNPAGDWKSARRIAQAVVGSATASSPTRPDYAVKVADVIEAGTTLTTGPASFLVLRDESRTHSLLIMGPESKFTVAPPRFLSLREVQQQARPSVSREIQGLLQYLGTPKQRSKTPNYDAWLWVLRRDSAHFVPLALNTYELNRLIARLRTQLRPDERGNLPDVDLQALYRIHAAVLNPIEPYLRGARHLFIVPSGGLETLPFHLLVSSPPKGDAGIPPYKEVDWLARHFAISVLPSVSALRALRSSTSHAAGTEPFIGFGDPALSDELSPSSSRNLRMVTDVKAFRQVASLPETADELRRIAAILGAQESSLWLRGRATETNVKTIDLSRYRVIAFATHAVVAGELAGSSEPGLIMTPPAQANGADDGYLSSSEISQLKLNSEWVLLSACNTAAADGTPGSEGLSGLARSFIYAGSRTLFVSHWPVASLATVRLTTAMLREYSSSPGVGKAEAHRRAMIEMIDGEARFAHPFYWAPFVTVGDGGLPRLNVLQAEQDFP